MAGRLSTDEKLVPVAELEEKDDADEYSMEEG